MRSLTIIVASAAALAMSWPAAAQPWDYRDVSQIDARIDNIRGTIERNRAAGTISPHSARRSMAALDRIRSDEAEWRARGGGTIPPEGRARLGHRLDRLDIHISEEIREHH